MSYNIPWLSHFTEGVFRAKLMDMEREMETLKQHNNDLQMKLSSKDKNTLRFEKKIRNLEQEKGMLQKTQTAYEYSKRELESEVSPKYNRPCIGVIMAPS